MSDKINEYTVGGDGEDVAEPVPDVVNLTSTEKVYEEEVEIKFLRHPEKGRAFPFENKAVKIFPVNDDIIKQKHLIPCDKDGRAIKDTRVFR